MPAVYGKGKRGSELQWAKLNETLIRRIRQEHHEKEEAKRKLDEQYGIRALSKRYQVHPRTIEKVLSYETWRHVL